MLSSLRRVAVAAVVTVCAMLAMVSPVFAHIDPDPVEAPAGSEQSVGFTVQHGCDGSPTLQLDMRLPEGVSGAVPQPPDGWTGTMEGNVVTFVGGPLDDDVELTFRVSMILPLLPDTTIFFPFVQRCQVGEIRWIDIPQDDSGEELDEPAPAMLLTAPLPGTTEPATPTTTVPTTAPTMTSPPAASSSIPVATDLAVKSTTLDSSSPSASTPSASAPLSDEDVSKGGAGSAIFVGVIVVVVAGAAVLTWQARRRR